MDKLLLCALIVLFLASCGGEAKQEDSVVVNMVHDTVPPPASVALSQPSYGDAESYDPEIAPYLKVLDSIYTQAPVYFKHKGQYYFYVTVGEKYAFWNDDKKTPEYAIGIVTNELDTILPIEYHKLYNPDATAVGYIEIEKDGKCGLLNYNDRTIIAPKYEIIFPTNRKDAIAIGKRGNQHFGILTDGTELPITNPKDVPRYLHMKKELELDVMDPKWRLLMNSYAYYYADEAYQGFEEGRGVFLPPSYINATGFFDEVIGLIDIGEDVYFSLTESKNTIEGSVTNKNGFNVILSSFYENGAGARENFIKHKHLASVDSYNNVVGKQTVMKVNYENWYLCPDTTYSYRFVNDSLIEIKVQSLLDESKQNYVIMPAYLYVSIDKGGQLKRLKTDRLFSFTKYTVIDESYFYGCFIKMPRDSDNIVWPQNDRDNALLTDHLTIEDLDIMRNEIFAEYGYKFKLEKWDKYFRSKGWYYPRFDNVDDKLTDIEKANLEVIKRVREKLLKDSNKYLNERFDYYYPGA